MQTLEEYDVLTEDEKKKYWEEHLVPIMYRATKGQMPTEEEKEIIKPHETLLRPMFKEAWELIDSSTAG